MFNNKLKMNPLADAVRKVMEADKVEEGLRSGFDHEKASKDTDEMKAKGYERSGPYSWKKSKPEAKPQGVANSSKQKDIGESKVDDMRDRLAAAKEKKADSYEFGKDKKSEAKPRAVAGSSYGGSKQKDVEESFASRLIARAKEINEAKSSGTEPTFTDNNIGETLSRSAKAGDYIDDFVHSKNPKFAGKSKKERINMALGAYYGKKNENVELEESDCVTPPQAKNIADKEVDKHEKKMHDKKADLVKKEEVEQQDEAKSESKKDFQARQERLAAAAAQTAKDPARLKRMMSIPGYSAAMGLANKTTTKEEVEQIDELKTGTLMRYATKANQSMIGGDRSKEDKRIKGIHLATNKIKQSSQKSVKEEEQIDELSKKTLKSYMSKAVDSDLGMPKHSKNPEARMKGIGTAHKKLLQEPQKSMHESNDHHTHAAHYEDPKTGEWTGMSLLSAKSDEDAIHQAHKMCKAGCRLSKVERHIAVKEDVEHIEEKLGKKETIDTLRGREGKVPLEAKISNAHTSHKVELKSEDIGPDGSEGWKDKPKMNKDKSGAVHSPMSRVKHLAKQAMKKINKDHGMKNETMMGKISN